MQKVKTVGNCFVQIGESLINLKGFKEINKYYFGLDEDPDKNSAFGISFTPLAPSQESIENGVDGSYIIPTYTHEEQEDFENDFELIISALKEETNS